MTPKLEWGKSDAVVKNERALIGRKGRGQAQGMATARAQQGAGGRARALIALPRLPTRWPTPTRWASLGRLVL